jgi:hypothetical protein
VEIDNPTKAFVKLSARVFWYLGGAIILSVSERPSDMEPNNMSVGHIGPLGRRWWELWFSGLICHDATSRNVWFRSSCRWLR